MVTSCRWAGVGAALALLVLLSGCQVADPIEATPDVVIGEWASTEPEGGPPAVLTFASDGSFALEGVPDFVFCSAREGLPIELDWGRRVTVVGTWEIGDFGWGHPTLGVSDSACGQTLELVSNGDGIVLRLPNGAIDDVYEHIDFVKTR